MHLLVNRECVLRVFFRMFPGITATSRGDKKTATNLIKKLIVSLHCLQISFPLAWLLYSAPKGWEYINFVHFLAPYVILGIGLDDIFVAVSFFDNTKPFMRDFALDTRLTATFHQAAPTMLATCASAQFIASA
jgi:hypothetical protein